MERLAFYDRHPINEAHILDTLRRRGQPSARVPPEALFSLDQDHYGGLAAIEVIARRAGITSASRVLDVGAGLGGPVRFLASRLGCRATGVELHAGRAAAAHRLTRLVGLAGRVRIVRADAVAIPLTTGAFDACISQEAWLHVERKDLVLRECHRVLRPGGRLAFTDWIAHARLGEGERARLVEWMAAVNLPTVDRYRQLIAGAGFGVIDAEDLSKEWIRILRQRLEMYREMRAGIVERFGEAWYAELSQLYAFFVALVEGGKIGGGRFAATA